MQWRSLGSKRWARAAAVGLVAVVALVAIPTPASAPSEAAVPGELIVGYRRGTTPEQRANARSRADATLAERVVTGDGSRAEVERVVLPPGKDRGTAMRELMADPSVAYAEPNWIYTRSDHTDDPYYKEGRLWGMYGNSTTPSNAYGSQAGEAWERVSPLPNTGSRSIVVGVIDEGIQWTHPDLDANVWTNPGEDGGTIGSDDDRNGYIDDIHGWDFVNDDGSVYDSGGDDHGTHVAGTIGAEGGNNIGVAGVNWAVTYISAKFLGPNGGTLADAVRAVDYLTGLKARHGLDLVATNNSWGGGGYSQALHDAIIRAAKANILFVAAAGNDGTNNDKRARYPSNYDTTKGTTTEAPAEFDAVIAVAAIDRNGSKPRWSNYGAKTVDLGAPGADINSTLPADTYGSYSGTSMATPHVTGGLALYAATHTVRGAELRHAILSAAVFTNSLYRTTVSGGRLDVTGF